ncbi:cation:dicarboxylate symporter family transporter [Streptomyces sp. NPDC004250]|uniref:cation:dicarboxylate symporter family transporter n=1 Tax=Streptomyces sp. NPDC004250 TaxID=3364692 RepID=UPI00368DDC4B
MDLTVPRLVTVLLVLVTKGIAGVPSASIVVLFSVGAAVGLPAESIAILLAVDFVVEKARTGLNVEGNALAALVIAKSEGRFTDRDTTPAPSASGWRSGRGRRPSSVPATSLRPLRRQCRTPSDCDRARASAALGARPYTCAAAPLISGCKDVTCVFSVAPTNFQAPSTRKSKAAYPLVTTSSAEMDGIMAPWHGSDTDGRVGER